MEKYKRFQKAIDLSSEHSFQSFFDELTTDGWKIIYYNELINNFIATVTVVCKKN